MELQIFVVVFAPSGNNSNQSTHFFQNCHCRIGGAAAAQHQYLFLPYIQTASFDHGGKSVVIRIVSEEAGILTAYHRIHSPQFFGNGGEVIQEWDDLFFVGNGHIDSGKISVFQKNFDFFRFFLKEGIGVISQIAMDLGGIAVSQLPAQQSAFHQTTSV